MIVPVCNAFVLENTGALGTPPSLTLTPPRPWILPPNTGHQFIQYTLCSFVQAVELILSFPTHSTYLIWFYYNFPSVARAPE